MDEHPLIARVVAVLRRDEIVNCTRIIDGFLVEGTCRVPFWYTKTGVIIKWSVFLGLLTLFGLYLFFGYMHAQKRLKKGLAPLPYHRWLVSRSQRARVDPHYAYPTGYSTYRPDYYGMQTMPPPPVYDPNRPPQYEGNGVPEGATKTDPSQWRSEPTRQPAGQEAQGYASPAGPPPSALRADATGSSNPFRG